MGKGKKGSERFQKQGYGAGQAAVATAAAGKEPASRALPLSPSSHWAAVASPWTCSGPGALCASCSSFSLPASSSTCLAVGPGVAFFFFWRREVESGNQNIA